MVRGVFVAAAAVAAVLIWPGSGGSGRFAGSRAAGVAPPSVVDLALARPFVEADEVPAQTSWTPTYPRFLKPLSGQSEPVEDVGGDDIREVMFTFDDGPDLEGTPLVADTLERYGIKGIFFVNGAYLAGSKPEALQRRELVRSLAARGHLVGNHTLHHQNLCTDSSALDLEVDGNAELIAAATGVRPLLFRAPYGARCHRLDQALRARDLLQVGWNLDPQDWKSGDENAIVEYVTSRLHRMRGRSILLLHDTHPQSVRALPRILEWLVAENRRAARTGEPVVRIRDYSVFLPPPPPARQQADLGIDPLVRQMAGSFAGFLRSFARYD